LVEDKPLITFEGNKRFYVLSFDTQGAYLVALQSDSQKQVWQSRVIDSPPNRRPEVKWSLVDSNDGKTVTLTSARNEDLINYQLDWSTGKMIQTSKARQQPISGKANEPASPPLSKIEAQSPDGKLLAVTSEAHILLIDRDTGQVIRSIGVDGAANIAGVTFSTDGKLLKRVDKDGATWTIDVATGKILERTAARRPAVIEVEYSQAVANVESARARLARLKGLTDVNKETIDEAAQYLERADRQLQSLVAAVKDAHKLADTSRALAEMEFTRIKELVAKGAATDVQLEAARVKLASAEIQVRRLESILKQGVAITEPMTPPSVTALTTSTRSSSWLKSDSGSVDAQSLNVLDLAERYLRATADVKKAKNRIESMKGSKLAVSQQEANEAKIELEAAEKRVQLLSGFIKDAVNTARAEIATAEEELARVSQLSRKGFVAQTEVDRAKSRVDAARARVKQLETILSTVGMTKPDSTPPM
jgi:multidrug resistance efflux pump